MSALRYGFEILQAVAQEGGSGLTFSEVIERTGLPKSTAHRLLKELVELSALSQDRQSRTFRLGLLLARLGSAVTAGYDLRETARPWLQTLHDRTRHVATLGILGADAGIYLDKIEGRDFGIRLHSEIGKAFPLHCTAMGKALLSHADRETLRRILKRKLEPYTEYTITSPRKLRLELEQVAQTGYAVDREEITRGLMCVAAPVFGADGKIAGAMSCTFPSYVYTEHGIEKEIDAVLHCASGASGQPLPGERPALTP